MALIIKNLTIDSPNYDELSDDEDDFVKDPAQYRDQLPQPYRYIHELLDLFVDDIWEEIKLRENDKIAERSRVRPPKYDCAVEIQEYPSTTAMADSSDGRYIFLAYPRGLSILDANSRRLLFTLDDDQLDLTSLVCIIIGVETYLLVGIDSSNIWKTFGCAQEKLFPMKLVNEENAAKYRTVRCEPSTDGDYIGIVLEETSKMETVFEVYQLPKEAWLKEINDIKANILKTGSEQPSSLTQETELTKNALDDEDPSLEIPSTGSSDLRKKYVKDRIKHNDSRVPSSRKSKSKSPSSRFLNQSMTEHEMEPSISRSSKARNRSSGRSIRRSIKSESVTISVAESGLPNQLSPRSRSTSTRTQYSSKSRKGRKKPGFNNYKFTPASLVMRQRAPEVFQANNGTSPSATLKDLADPKIILGTGQGHLLTKLYTELRQQSFNSVHQTKLKFKTNNDTLNHRDCNFHFFSPGLEFPYGIEQPGALKKPAAVGIWWTDSCQMTFFSLNKPAKAKKPSDTQEPDIELKPDTVWPQASVITASAISPDSSILALGLLNGIITIWDMYKCCLRKSIQVSNSAIVRLSFLDPCICPQSNNRLRCYITTTSCYVLVRSHDSSLHLFNCGPLDYSSPKLLSEAAPNDDAVITSILPFPSRCSEIILKVHKNGSMFLQDVITGKTLCEIALPQGYSLTTPWQPIISIAAYGQMLYLKGTQREINHNTETVNESLFVFQLRSFPVMDAYWMRPRQSIPYLVMSTMDVRIGATLTERVKSSGARQQRLQQRWPLMKQELGRIVQLKSH